MYEKKECPACHCQIDEELSVCPFCGYDFSTYTQSPEQENKGNTINYCPNCGTKLSDEFSTCPNCGTKLSLTPSDKTSEEREGKGKYIVGLILKILLALIIISIIFGHINEAINKTETNEYLIRRVQHSYLEGYSRTANIETLVNSLITSADWRDEPAKRVIASGKTMFLNNIVTMEIGFVEDSDFNVSIYAIEVNGNPMNDEMIEGIINRMYDLATLPRINPY